MKNQCFYFYLRNNFIGVIILWVGVTILSPTITLSKININQIPRKSVLNKEKQIRLMKILFVVEKFPQLGETTILNQITGLIDRGHDVSIYATLGKGYGNKIQEDVRKYNLFSRTYYKDIPSDIASYDIIYCQFGPLGKQFLEFKKQFNLQAKLVTCFRGYDISRYIKQHDKDVYTSLFKEGDLFLPVCDYFKNKLIKYGCPENKIVTQHSAIDLSRFTFKERIRHRYSPIRILSVNRLIEKKGMQYAIQAIAQLVRKYPDIQYTIIGDGPLKRDLRNLIRSNNVRRNIHLVGWYTQQELIECAKKQHFLILPSVKASDGNEEGIPNALKEALAMGMPVVSTYHSGIPELVEPGVSGLLVEQRDVKGLAKAIEYLIKHPKVWLSMGEAGRKKIEAEFDVEVMNERLEKLFIVLLENKPA